MAYKVIILYRLYMPSYFLGTFTEYPFLLPKGMSPDIHVRLEEHGTAVWNLIDGHRTVREIISLLARHFGEEENYIPRVTAYVMQLRKDGFIQLTIRN